MREILAVLYPCMVLLYLCDCLIYVGKQEVAFISLLGRGFRLVKNGLHVYGVFPWSRVFSAGDLDLCPTASGIYLRSSEPDAQTRLDYPEDFRFIPYATLEDLKPDGRRVRLNNDTLLKTPSARYAKTLSNRLNRLVESEYADRNRLIEDFMRKDTDVERVRAIHRSHHRPFGYLVAANVALYLMFFVFLPAALYWILLSPLIFKALITAMVCLYLGTIMGAYYLLSKTYTAGSGVKSTAMLSITLSPVAAIHAMGYVSKDLFACYDRTALAAHLLADDKFDEFMRREIYRIRTACNQGNEFEWHEFWQMRWDAVRNLLNHMGRYEADLIAPPPKAEASAASYCPVCQSEYRSGFNFCSDCGVVLEAYAA